MDVNLITAISAAAGAVLSGVATTIAIIVAYKVHQNQKLLSQRQLLLPLWDYMATLSKIDSNTPVTPDVIKVVNTLELVALCCEGGMIDEKLYGEHSKINSSCTTTMSKDATQFLGFQLMVRGCSNRTRLPPSFTTRLRVKDCRRIVFNVLSQ